VTGARTQAAWGEPILNRVSNPILAQLREEGIIYRGVLYHGMWVENDGELPQVVENNVRFGDPEIQPIVMRLNSDILPYLMACAEGKGLAGLPPFEWDERPCVGVVLASGGYPGSYPKGKEITGIDDAEYIDGVHVFPAGVAEEGGKLFTSGGRVLLVAALGESKGDYKGAIDKAYAACDMINFEGMYIRDDIGHKALGGSL
jgi:phosphoribosylamine--glycine ligase